MSAGFKRDLEDAARRVRRQGADGAEAPVAACGGAPDQGTGEARRSGAGSRGSATFRPLRVLRRLPRFRAYPAG